VVILFGILIVDKLEHSSKIDSLIVVKLEFVERVTELKEVQYLKADAPIEVTEYGIVMEANPEP
jgi:hypothetical protein